MLGYAFSAAKANIATAFVGSTIGRRLTRVFLFLLYQSNGNGQLESGYSDLNRSLDYFDT